MRRSLAYLEGDRLDDCEKYELHGRRLPNQAAIADEDAGSCKVAAHQRTTVNGWRTRVCLRLKIALVFDPVLVPSLTDFGSQNWFKMGSNWIFF